VRRLWWACGGWEGGGGLEKVGWTGREFNWCFVVIS
jgi:hypothetical protein